jgi:DNA-binding NtrC family response regulator
MASILIVDDEPNICSALQRFLEGHGHRCSVAGNGDQARALAQRDRPDVVLLDVRLPGESGLTVLSALRTIVPQAQVLVMTAYGTMETAIAAMREGAFEYLLKPLELERVEQAVQHALQARAPVEPALRVASKPPPHGELVGRSSAMQEVYKTIGALTRHDVTVVITGESGTGKELVARAIHEHGERAREPFVAIHCGAIPVTLLESELFGHERGSFTDAYETKIGKFELAGAGTIFLDEIAEMSLALQVKMLRALQEREIERIGGRGPIPIKARILTATHRDLATQVARGLFREDLLYRLQVASIHLPPLRERPEDIEELAAVFLGRFGEELNKRVIGMSRAAVDRLLAYSWPGNVRELENVLQRAVVMCRGDVIDAQDLPLLIGADGPGAPDSAAGVDWRRSLRQYAHRRLDAHAGGEGLYDEMLLRVEQVLIEAALERHQGNQVATAQALGISRNTLRKRLVQFALLAPEPHAGPAVGGAARPDTARPGPGRGR